MAKINDLQFEVIETFQNEDGSRVASDGELPGTTTVYNPFPSPAPQFGQCEKMERSIITGLNAARWNCSNNCVIRIDKMQPALALTMCLFFQSGAACF